ncbi:uncharacterized protein LOC124139096 [Haliotis rufescens]|uniref:uncharacterized protein LOC124139096 n=1 Tax=Haliotis rufescens TaxID=6454 RepID=UPI00201EB595|nr:uncharacterized protein LOC124139096 [Haliotis rufescens]XP_046362069.2 uncharacterized protein LOC124139096 [Haliotis rufescens]XP_046362070.2 uncharacterized protein LOC124139096 [Haliotis rufescens]XP_046362071.2 uncharacterized protein LOC124139096 [Haliotis rufescens]
MALLRPVVCLCLCLSLAEGASEREHSVHHNFNYPFVIDAVAQEFEGRVCSNMELFALIPVEPEDLEKDLLGGACVTNVERYLKIDVRNVSWNPDVVHHKKVDSPISTTTLMPPHGGTRSPHSTFIDLPEGVAFDVLNTELIDVDDAYYIVVSDPDAMREEKEIQFYVVLVTTATNKIVSNPLPFAVRVDHPSDEGRPHGAALFAGVLVLVIILIALLIPITVCVKRRRKAGKPVCTCGSPDVEKDERKGHVNNGYVTDTRDSRTDSTGSSNDLNQTIGSHQLRSVAKLNFEPTWLDPHYKELQEIPGTSAQPDPPSGTADIRL